MDRAKPHELPADKHPLGSHVERARKTLKEIEGRWDLKRALKYTDD